MIVAGDFHLGLTSDSVLVDGVPSRIVDTKTRLMEAMQIAAEEPDKTLAIAGDLFHRYALEPMTVEAVLQAFHFANKLGIKVYLIPGNHDCDVRWSATVLAKEMRRTDLITISKPTYVLKIGIFLPHMPRSIEIPFLKKEKSYGTYITHILEGEKKKLLLIGHAHVNGAANAFGFDIRGSGTAMEFNPKQFPAAFSLAIFGHIHCHQIIHSGRGYDIVYTGPAIATNFGEVDVPNGCIRVDPKIGKWEFVRYASKVHEYKHIKINLTDRKGLPSFDEEKIKSTVGGKLLKITVFAKSAFHVDEAGIKKVFNKYATVMRMEYKIESSRTPTTVEGKKQEILLGSLDHMTLLKDFIRKTEGPSKEVKDRAVEVGREVVSECLGG